MDAKLPFVHALSSPARLAKIGIKQLGRFRASMTELGQWFIASHAGTTAWAEPNGTRDLGREMATTNRILRAANGLRSSMFEYVGGRCYTARETRTFARDIGLVPLTTPISSLQSNGMAEAFVRTLERDSVRVSPKPDARTVIDQLPGWLAHHDDVHPRSALGYRSPASPSRKPARPCQVNDTAL